MECAASDGTERERESTKRIKDETSTINHHHVTLTKSRRRHHHQLYYSFKRILINITFFSKAYTVTPISTK